MKSLYSLFIIFGLLAGCASGNNFLEEPNRGGGDSTASGSTGSEGASSGSDGNQH